MTTPLDQLRDLLDEIEASDAPRAVVRWIDETRPVPHQQSGYTVQRVTSVIVTAKIGGKPVQRTLEGLTRADVEREARGRSIHILYRSDNLTR